LGRNNVSSARAFDVGAALWFTAMMSGVSIYEELKPHQKATVLIL